MKLLRILDGYLYLPDYNILLNDEFKDIFLKYSDKKEIPVEEVEISEENILENIRSTSQLSFELTQDCNLRCNYCPYNTNFSYERKRSTLSMTPGVASSGLLYVQQLFKDRIRDDFMIGFYGGEPLLNFRTLKYITDYSKKLFGHMKLTFSVTTNGTLLDDEIMDFLVSNDFTTMISLDGPSENHDAKRVFPNKKGSFEIVWNNIIKMKKAAPDYFKKKVLFSAVYSYDLSLIGCFNFFFENEAVKGNNIRFNFVNTQNSDYDKRYPNKHQEVRKHHMEISERISQHIKAGKNERIPITKEFDLSVMKELLSRKFSLMAGACDFSNKLFLDCTGRFHICEKINDKFPIGDSKTGIDILKVKGILDGFLEVTKKHCLNCEVRSLCNPCYVNFAGNGKFEFDKKFCEERKKYIKYQLERYIVFNSLVDERTKKSPSTTTMRFHQYVKLERGPKNTAIIDFLKGELFHVENHVLDSFNNGDFDTIGEFIKEARDEDLLIKIPTDSWVPQQIRDDVYLDRARYSYDLEHSIYLELEDGVDLNFLSKKLSPLKVLTVNYYGPKRETDTFRGVKIEYLDKNIDRCIDLIKVDGQFSNIQENRYLANKNCNSCWSKRLAITTDGKVKLCIYGTIIIGDIIKDPLKEIIQGALKYWKITRDSVEQCKDCEFKYICFDCRELAYRKSKNLYSKNPFCSYNPMEGKWGQ